MKDGTWRDRARCKGKPTEWWFPSLKGEGKRRFEESQVMVAKGWCEGCGVSEQCLAEALRMKDNYGIFGGLDAKERRTLLRARGVQLKAAG